MTSATQIAEAPIPRLADVESGAGGYWPSTSSSLTTSRATPDGRPFMAGPMNQVMSVYLKKTSTAGTPAVPTGLGATGSYSDGPTTAHAAWGFDDLLASGSTTLSWAAGTGTLSYAASFTFQTSGLDRTTPIADTNFAVGTLSSATIDLPKVTPTSDKQNVIHVLLVQANNQMTQGASQFKSQISGVTPDIAFSRLSGSVVIGVIGLTPGQCQAGVPIGASFSRLVASASNYVCITFLVNPALIVKPRALPFSWPGYKILYNHNWYGETPVGTQDFPIPVGLRAADVEYGDVLVLYTFVGANNYGVCTVGNSGAMDHVIQSPVANMTHAVIMLKRLTSAADLTALAASPPTMTFTYATSGGYFYAIIRGLQRSGSYLVGSTSTTAVPAHNTGDMLFLPIWLQDDDEVYLTGKVDPDDYFAWHEQSADSGMHAFTDIHSSVTTFPVTWIGSNTINPYAVVLRPSGLTNWQSDDIQGGATVSTVMTSEPGAKFVVSDVDTEATVTTHMNQYHPQFKHPHRNLIWAYDLHGNKVNVID